jgi:3-oxoacyl-[acyl-carrier-protein] synthase II
MNKKAVITGIGAITPLGLNANESWKNLRAGKSGVGLITSFDASDLEVKIAAEVKDFHPGDYIDLKSSRRMSRFAQFCVAAAKEAADDANLDLTVEEQPRAASAIATGAGGILNTFEEMGNYITKGPSRVSPFFIPLMAPNMGACQVSMTLGLRGPALASTAACASGLYSFIEAHQLIASGACDVVVAGGGEAALHPVAIAALSNMRALSRNNDNPEEASRPFDRDRDGFVFGEGAVVFIIESEERALRRNTKIYAELLGGGLSCDANHITAPLDDGSGAAQAIETALQVGGIEATDVNYISAHGTGTALNDVSETKAIKLALGEQANHVAVSATKSMVGHLLGGAGALGVFSCVKAITDEVIPPTINLDTPATDCDLDYVPLNARESKVNYALTNGFGFGGQNGCVLIGKYQN